MIIYKARRSELDLISQEGHYQVDMGDFIFDFYFRPSRSKRAIVFSPGFLDTKTYQYPYFQRIKWFSAFDAVAISLADPTLSLSPDVGIGWFVGNARTHYLKECAHFISELLRRHGIAQSSTLYFGSSAGGFASLGMAAHNPGSHAFAINPQTDIREFHSVAELYKTFKASFASGDLLSISKKFENRLSLSKMFEEVGHRPPMTIWQNMQDRYHYERHLIPFLERLPDERSVTDVEVLITSDSELGHNPPSLNALKSIFDRLIARL